MVWMTLGFVVGTVTRIPMRSIAMLPVLLTATANPDPQPLDGLLGFGG